MRISDAALRRAALYGVILFLVIVAVEHLAAPSLDPQRHRVSEYVNTSTGALMVAGFAAWACSLAALAELVRRDGEGVARSATVALLTLAAAGVVVTAAFPTQTSAGVLPAGVELSATGRLHDLASGIVTLALAAAVVVSAVAYRRHPRALLRLVTALLLLTVVLAGTLAAVGAPGLRQRSLILAACSWQLLLLWALRRRSAQYVPPATDPPEARCTLDRTS